ncbi:Fimbrial protein precursor [Photobacterium damselae subsp. piscicida]|uniref:Fimbrial protein n=1 Tax=Photobacterium damsela subsp. piscicida TaxID=38294 RepID=A0A1V1V5U4_PHODP|nr:pilin [Photobacterium damselae]MBE8128328.1 pilin [Photobacterium damselae subsp. piscicida]MDP2515195.1 pilin [Photobacterium damselae subsp. piscicida]MDP2533720.1 pilin [Photobacterium damselae subsp. piscicida]MDP2545225.1 pilin [Photobacterium damselae subsp. piscicida]MDP2557491.1 pilin [Photobacterium damselae subsp. piscicida]
MKGQKGFTLIELMIVVAIIGVLSAIAIPAYKDYVKKSQMASAMATMKSLITPAELEIQENGSISGGISTLGIITANSDNLVFKFVGGAMNNDTLTFKRTDADGWSCTRSDTTGMPDIEGCK